MADVGWVQLRRGILEHLASGRMTSDEFAAFTVILLKADHRNGVWRGTGKSLARLLGWCERKGRTVLAALAAKGYLSIARARNQHSRSVVTVARYFGERSAAPGCRASVERGMRMPRNALCAAPGCRQEQEVIQERKPHQEGAPPNSRREGEIFQGIPESKPNPQFAKRGEAHARRKHRSESEGVELQRSVEALA